MMIDFHIHLTDRAIESFNQKIEKRNTPHAHIRLGIRGGGCKGFTYVIQFEDNKPSEKDVMLFFNGIRILVDKKSSLYLNGCTVDYEKSLIGEGFKFINKREKARCGCNSSFDI